MLRNGVRVSDFQKKTLTLLALRGGGVCQFSRKKRYVTLECFLNSRYVTMTVLAAACSKGLSHKFAVLSYE